jgi:hypothetical protein
MGSVVAGLLRELENRRSANVGPPAPYLWQVSAVRRVERSAAADAEKRALAPSTMPATGYIVEYDKVRARRLHRTERTGAACFALRKRATERAACA